MRIARSLSVALLALAICALCASVAAAAEIVPPGNSAASQYTEAFPTHGGERETEGSGKGRAVPAKTLGARNAEQLESKGKDGRAVAEFAAETAPAPVVTETQSSGGSKPDSGEGGGVDKGSGGTARSGDGGGPASGARDGAATATLVTSSIEEPAGSSGVGEVLGEATGSSSGELGLLLPLIVIGVVVWSLFYLWRRRRQGQRVA